MPNPSMSRRRLLAVVLTSTAVLAACGGDDGVVASSGEPESSSTTAADTTTAEAYPLTVSSGGFETTIEAEPAAIVSLSPSATEMLFAIGAGDAVVAVDSLSNFPAEAPITDLSAYDPNVEALIGYEPDLVVVSGDINDMVAALEAVDVPTLVLPASATLEDTYDQIELLGEVTGDVEGATDVVEGMREDIDALIADLPELDEPLTFFHELDDTLYSVTSSTFIGELYGLVGLENIADAADPEGESFGYPQLSAEFLVEADPDLVFLADTKCCGQSLETFGDRPGFSELTAVTRGAVFPLDDDIASRWGPRVVDFLEEIVEAVRSTQTGG